MPHHAARRLERIAAFKVPAHVRFHDEALPRVATGKLCKRQLKAELAEQLRA